MSSGVGDESCGDGLETDKADCFGDRSEGVDGGAELRDDGVHQVSVGFGGCDLIVWVCRHQRTCQAGARLLHRLHITTE